ncbi:MAG: flagellar motor switch protein FliN [Treponema sp.]|nr:flagellar motor switch protein FliN [Treponema sp.]
MSDGAISQDEIDALLSGVNMDGLGGGGGSAGAGSSINTAVLGNFANGLKERLSADLGTMTSSAFDVADPVVEAVDKDQLLAKLPETVVTIQNDFSNAVVGEHLYIISPEFAKKLASLVNQSETAELDDMAFSIVSEAFSKHTGNEITDLEHTGKLSGIATSPAEAVNVPKAMARIPQNTFALISYPITHEGQVYTMWEALAGDVVNTMTNALSGDTAAAGGSAAMDGGGILSASDMAAMGSLVGGGAPMGGNMGGASPMGMNVPNVQPLSFPNLGGGPATVQQGNIGLIMDVFMEMTVELGRTKKQIKDILGMGEGTIIELDKLAGEPVDILVNHKPIAKGEVVVIDENFGVRVTEILSPMERVSTLN